MQIEEESKAASAAGEPGQRDGFEFTALGVTDEIFTKLKSDDQNQRFFRWGIRLNEDLFVRRFRYNQVFYPVGAIEFLKHLLNSDAVRAQLPSLSTIGEVTDVSFKQMTCNVINMNYFDFLEELRIVNPQTATIQGCIEEYINNIPCGDKLRTALLFDEDENYEELQQDKYQNEFIFKLMQFIILGGAMNQFEQSISEYLECTKDLYKDLVCVAKDEATNEVKPMSHVFKITGLQSSNGVDLPYDDAHP